MLNANHPPSGALRPGFGPAKASKIKYVLHYFGHRDFSDEA
ncbi:hypothetical protein GGP78_000406 [Salinibacter ruber]|uniref:Uncharacterized protein n=1 Tax=Salinibacter ruber TaxID=146919 RepID=A0AAW5P2D8_9BACT|nr:hypothetical protein [Salinibacter ruber]MCS3853756.1 hypothetical protein [Salinibacter ruber]MCS4156107.1 hypothetical protein [Salinibacter ruber]